jgi:hypothetical protein
VRVITDMPLWEPSCSFNTQSCHVGWGAFIVLSVWTRWPRLAWPVLIAWILLKEFVFDLTVERDTVFGSGEDGLFYLVGGLIATFVIHYWSRSCRTIPS